jgi:PPOX class probable F420-dependent enzyme
LAPLVYSDEQFEFVSGHVWAILATSRRDGSPQQSMIGYALDPDGRFLISTQAATAKWRNALRQPKVSLTVPDGRVHVVVYGRAEGIENDPERAELSADVLAAVRDAERPDPASILDWLNEGERRVLRITPERVFRHD